MIYDKKKKKGIFLKIGLWCWFIEKFIYKISYLKLEIFLFIEKVDIFNL